MSAAACSVRVRSRPVMPTLAPRVARPMAVALPIPPVAPVIRTTLPAMGSVSGIVRAANGDDEGSPRMSFSDMIDRLACLTQRIHSADDRRDLPGFDQSFQDDQIRPVLKFDRRTQLSAVEH